MKIVILTRTGFHHTCFINRLQERFEISCVVRESYPEIKRETVITALLKNLFKRNGVKAIKDTLYLKRFHEMNSAGFRYSRVLKDYMKAPFDVLSEESGTRYMNIKCGEINTPAFETFLRDTKPDVIAVLGSSVIRPHIISIPSVAMLNLHSGLSPYYRGTWSYGWPIVNKEPEYIGATIHNINPGTDTGDILYQTRPALHDSDDLNTIFLKVISEGIELMADAVGMLVESGAVSSYKQPENVGRQYFSRDLSADIARHCLSNLGDGIIRSYNAAKKERDSRVRLYGYVPPRLFL